MPRKSPYDIRLSAEEARELSRRAAKYTLPYFEVIRAKIILLAAQGLRNDEIAARLNARREVVSMWRKRFFEQSMKLLQVVLGAIDVPGGVLAMPSIFGDFGSVRETADGMLTPTYLFMLSPGYPVRRVTAPESTAARELFPLYWSATPMDLLTLPEPEKYKVPYKAEIFLHCRTNTMTNSVAPDIAAKALKSIPFMVSICTEIDETSELADIILPDVNYLEGMSFFPNFVVQCGGMGTFWYMYGHPVVEPAFKAPFRIYGQADILMELAERAGFLEDFNQMINIRFGLKDPYKLEPSKRHSMAEVYDRMAKSWFGEKYGLDWFKEHRVMQVEKTVQQAYPRIFHTARVPVYTEHFLEAGERVKKVTRELGIEWDTSDYQALPEWKPCPAYLEDAPGYDLYCINYKMPMHTFGVTTNNPWLAQRSDDRRLYDIVINEESAARRGIEDGDRVKVETPEGRHVVGVAKTTQGMHPEVVAVPGIFGQWARARTIAKGKGVHSSSLLPLDLSRIDTLSGAVDHTVRVKVTRVEARR